MLEATIVPLKEPIMINSWIEDAGIDDGAYQRYDDQSKEHMTWLTVTITNQYVKLYAINVVKNYHVYTFDADNKSLRDPLTIGINIVSKLQKALRDKPFNTNCIFHANPSLTKTQLKESDDYQDEIRRLITTFAKAHNNLPKLNTKYVAI